MQAPAFVVSSLRFIFLTVEAKHKVHVHGLNEKT